MIQHEEVALAADDRSVEALRAVAVVGLVLGTPLWVLVSLIEPWAEPKLVAGLVLALVAGGLALSRLRPHHIRKRGHSKEQLGLWIGAASIGGIASAIDNPWVDALFSTGGALCIGYLAGTFLAHAKILQDWRASNVTVTVNDTLSNGVVRYVWGHPTTTRPGRRPESLTEQQQQHLPRIEAIMHQVHRWSAAAQDDDQQHASPTVDEFLQLKHRDLSPEAVRAIASLYAHESR